MANNGSKVGCWIAIAILVLMLFGSFLANIGLTAAVLAGSSPGYSDYPVDAEPNLDEIWSQGYGETKVVRIGLSGIIMRGQPERLFGSGSDMVESILSQILAARLDPAVRAILLEVDSPGGAVTPSDEIYTALRHFKESAEDRVVVVFIRDLGASGAYYAAMAGDYIMAEPTAIVGSVGVIMQTLNMKGLADMIGLKSVTIASGANKDMLNPLKEVDPQHLAMLQELVDEMQNRFAGIVMDSRGIESRMLLDGRVFTAEQALNSNLIDGIGYWQESVEQLKLLLDVDDVYIVRYAEKQGFLDALFAATSPNLPDINTMESPRFLYLWKP
jgi:protease-4